jgi:hypothetical protein
MKIKETGDLDLILFIQYFYLFQKENKGGKVVSVKLTVYGTKTAPAHYSTARTYEYLVDSEWDKFPTAQCPA